MYVELKKWCTPKYTKKEEYMYLEKGILSEKKKKESQENRKNKNLTVMILGSRSRFLLQKFKKR